MEIYKTTSKQYCLLWQSDAGIRPVRNSDKGQDLFRLQPEEPGRTDGSAYDHFYDCTLAWQI